MKKLLIFSFLLVASSTVFAQKTVRYDLYISDTTVHIGGGSSNAIAINGHLSGPTLTFTEGDTANVFVHNLMDMETSLHSHGVILPNMQDGVPYLTTAPTLPHTTHLYSFPVVQNGTFFYHAHTDLQEQSGFYGAYVFLKRPNDRSRRWQDTLPQYTILLSDWTNESPSEVLRSLHMANDWYSIEKHSTQSWGEALTQGYFAEKAKQEWLRMFPMDVSDVYYNAFLMNGQIEQRQPQLKAGSKIRLRIINASSSTYFWLQYAGGKISVIASDGADDVPVDVDRIIVGVAETYDVVVAVPENMSYEFKATSEDRTNSTSLWLGDGMKMPAPVLAPLKYFEGMKMMNQMMHLDGTMSPMGMQMSDQRMDMNSVMYPELSDDQNPSDNSNSMGNMPGMDMGKKPGMNMGKMKDTSMGNMPGMKMDKTSDTTMGNMPGMNMEKDTTMKNMPGMHMDMKGDTSKMKSDTSMSNMPGMQMRKMSGMKMGKGAAKKKGKISAKKKSGKKKSGKKKTTMPGMNMGTMPGMKMNYKPGMNGMQDKAVGLGVGMSASSVNTTPLPETGTRKNTNPDKMPDTKLDAIPDTSMNMAGMNMSSDIVTLSYSMLKATQKTTLPNAPTKILQFDLTGNMNRFEWSINNTALSAADVIVIPRGTNVRIILNNQTMMRHPMHLHGHYFRVLNGMGDYSPLKNTLDIMPMEIDTIEFAAQYDGDWFFHCHILYHMMSGMGRVFRTNANGSVTPVPNEQIDAIKNSWDKFADDDNMWHFSTTIAAQSQGVFPKAILMDRNYMFDLMGMVNYKGKFESETHFARFIDRQQFLKFYIGSDIRMLDDQPFNASGNTVEHRKVATLGVQYLLPMFLQTDLRIDHTGRVRFQISRNDLALTSRLRFDAMWNTDKDYEFGLRYIFTKRLSLSASYDDHFGAGAGVTFTY